MTAALVLATVAAVELVAVVGLTGLLARSRREVATLRDRLAHPARSPHQTPAGLMVQAVVTTATRIRERGLVRGLLMSSLDDLNRWVREQRADIARVAAPDGTVTIFFCDIESSTTLNEQLGDTRWMQVLDAHNALVRRSVAKRGGHVVKSQGDGFMVVFGESTVAVAAAIDIQQALARHPGRRLRRTPVKVRIGLHVGEAVSRDGDYFGRNVAMAARVAAAACGGEVLVTDAVRDVVGEQDEVVLLPRGEVELKGLADRHLLWEVRY